MTTLVRWDPFAEFAGLRRAFYGIAPRSTRTYDFSFPVDVSETDAEVVVKAIVPGVKADEIDISVNDGILTIKGEKKSDETAEGENFFRREIRYGTFARSIALPSRVDHDKAGAEFADGVLTITLPKAEDARPKTITVKAAASA